MNRDAVRDWLRDRRDQLYANRYYWRAFVFWPVWFAGPQFIGGYEFHWVQIILLFATAAMFWNLHRQRGNYIIPRYYFYREKEADEVPSNWIRRHPQQDHDVRYLAQNEKEVYGAGAICVSHTYLNDHLIAKLSCPKLVSPFEVEELLAEYHADDLDSGQFYIAMGRLGAVMSQFGMSPPELPVERGGHWIYTRRKKK